jgi:hypothetical protein
MLMNSESEKWRIYEQEKQHIFTTSESSEEYERRIGELCKRLGL